jgi:hypothetical protein
MVVTKLDYEENSGMLFPESFDDSASYSRA